MGQRGRPRPRSWPEPNHPSGADRGRGTTIRFATATAATAQSAPQSAPARTSVGQCTASATSVPIRCALSSVVSGARVQPGRARVARVDGRGLVPFRARVDQLPVQRADRVPDDREVRERRALRGHEGHRQGHRKPAAAGDISSQALDAHRRRILAASEGCAQGDRLRPRTEGSLSPPGRSPTVTV